MTAIVPGHIATKKQLREKLAAGESVMLDDPTPWGSRTIVLNMQHTDGSGEVSHTVDGIPLRVGQFITCTNHPKRSWFAEIEVQADGGLKVR